jgi:cardiolipin synthase
LRRPGSRRDVSSTDRTLPSDVPSGAAERMLLTYADRAFARATGAPLIAGNAVRLLYDAAENYPAWLAAIGEAERSILFESYLIDDDDVGREFIAALAAKARSGVRVRVLYDWLGSWGADRLWAELRAAGAQVGCFNPFRLEAPLGWVSRDHRKTIVIDGCIGFVTGLCVSTKWIGDPDRRREPWRDTGVEIRGPAVTELERAFARIWTAAGKPPIPAHEFTTGAIPPAGDVPLRVVAGEPDTAGVFRLDHVVASAARRYLWVTDAYFVGVSAYVQALAAAARDGVDVRLLVPGASDIPAVRPLSRANYRPLLAAGVRVFEWNGTMLHAKTAVADGLWARVGSTNLNLASWMQNWELDVAIEDRGVAAQLAERYEEDLRHATEIVLTRRNRVRVASPSSAAGSEAARRAVSGSAGRAAAGALSVGSAFGAALTNRRVLVRTEAGLLARLALAAVALAVVALIWPLVLAIPFAIVAGWLGVATLWRAWTLAHEPRRRQPRVSVPAKAGEAGAPPGDGGFGGPP